MKKFIILILLCIGVSLHAQENKLIYYSDCYTQNNILYSRPTLIIVSDIEIKVIDAKSYKILENYAWIAVKVDEGKNETIIRYKALDDNGKLYNLSLGYYVSNKEIVFGVKELGRIYRRLKQL